MPFKLLIGVVCVLRMQRLRQVSLHKRNRLINRVGHHLRPMQILSLNAVRPVLLSIVASDG